MWISFAHRTTTFVAEVIPDWKNMAHSNETCSWSCYRMNLISGYHVAVCVNEGDL
jgi:hypothetical protein